MKIFIFTLILFISSTNLVSSQKLEFKGSKIFENGEKLSNSELIEKFSNNQELLKTYKNGRGNIVLANILGGIGGFGVGWTLGELISSKEDMNYTPAIIGAGLIIAGIPINISGNKKLKEVVENYNQTSAYINKNKTELKIVSTQNGVGLRLSF